MLARPDPVPLSDPLEEWLGFDPETVDGEVREVVVEREVVREVVREVTAEAANPEEALVNALMAIWARDHHQYAAVVHAANRAVLKVGAKINPAGGSLQGWIIGKPRLASYD